MKELGSLRLLVTASSSRASARRTAVFGLAVLLFAEPSGCSSFSFPPEDIPVAGAEILWDTYGVPHIYAADRQGLAYAFGWAQMRNHSDLLLRLFVQGRGRASELLGRSYLEDDRWAWTIGIPDMAAREYSLQTPEMRAHVDAFVAGINDFATHNPAMIGDSVRAVLPVTASDIFANLSRLTYARFITSREGVSSQSRTWERGSNAWAVAPSRSASGHTLLLENPHLPWGDILTWIEAEYSMPGIDVHGAALVGNPVLQMAFNDHLGWAHTVNTQDGEDLYELTLSGIGYLFDGKVRPFDEGIHVIHVRGGADDTVRIRRSIQGPVVASKPGKAIALRAVGMEPPLTSYAYQQWWDMGRAKNFSEFQAAIKPNQISGQNITYGDREGHIMMFYGGNSPIRSRGDRAFWAGVVPGDSSSTLWTALHPFSDMPMTLDPPAGWVQNANNPPWWSTFPVTLKPRDFPSYLAPLPMGLRPQRSVHILQSDSSITFAEFIQYKHSTRMELADRVLDELLRYANRGGDADAKRASDVLSRWDRSTDATSRGAVLFTEWWAEFGRRMDTQSRWAVRWSEQRPLDTPSGISDTLVAVSSLSAAARIIESRYGAIDVPWGDVYRFRRDSLDLPGNGGAEAYGIFRVIGYTTAPQNRFRAVGGDSYFATIEFASPVRAMSLVSYGNASRAGSPHRTDQLPLLSRKELKPVLMTRAEVEAHTELREKLPAGAGR